MDPEKKPDSHIFQLNVVVEGETEEEAWKNLQMDPRKYLPEKPTDRILVKGANSSLRMVTSYGSGPEPTEKQKAYAAFHGWDFVCKENLWEKMEWSFHKGEIRVIWWGGGWAPSHPATGVFDNAAWGEAICALNVADQMFFGGHRDDKLGWFGLLGGVKRHPARPDSE